MDDTKLESAFTASRLAGAVTLVGGRDGVRSETVWGVREAGMAAAMTVDTLFQIASMTKAITSVAALQLVERGILSLDDPIGGILPELDTLQVLDGFDDAGNPRLRPARSRITLRQLFTHTSGLGYFFMSPDLMMLIEKSGMPEPGSLASISLPLLCDPGERWEYGVSTDWIGLAVERASGMKLDDYFAAHITGPLGMTDTVFFPDAEQETRCAAVHARLPDGAIAPVPFRISADPQAELLSGGGGLWSTARDYFAFLRTLLAGGAPLLSPEMTSEMMRNQIGAMRAGQMTTAIAEFAHPFDLFPDQQCGWGLGFLINSEPGPNGRAAGSLAWAGIANSYYWIDPASDTIGIFMSQLMPFGDPGALAAFKAFESTAYSP